MRRWPGSPAAGSWEPGSPPLRRRPTRAPRPGGRGCSRAAAARPSRRASVGSWQWLEDEGEVERGCTVGDRTHRDEVYAGPRNRPERLGGPPAAGLQCCPPGHVLDGLAQLGGGHVVQQELRCPGLERLVDLGQRAAL